MSRRSRIWNETAAILSPTPDSLKDDLMRQTCAVSDRCKTMWPLCSFLFGPENRNVTPTTRFMNAQRGVRLLSFGVSMASGKKKRSLTIFGCAQQFYIKCIFIRFIRAKQYEKNCFRVLNPKSIFFNDSKCRTNVFLKKIRERICMETDSVQNKNFLHYCT